MPCPEAHSHSDPSCPEGKESRFPAALRKQGHGGWTLGTHAPFLSFWPIYPLRSLTSPSYRLTILGLDGGKKKMQRERQEDFCWAKRASNNPLSRLKYTETLTTIFPAHICTHLFGKHPGFWRLILSLQISWQEGPLVTLGPRWHGLRHLH